MKQAVPLVEGARRPPSRYRFFTPPAAALPLVFALAMLTGSAIDAALIPSADGLTVYDTILHVTWLANANLAGTGAGRFGIAAITPNGAMDYATALQWVAALNAASGGAGYLGHNNWQLPASPVTDTTCSATGPNGNSFGFGCTNSAMGSLYYESLALHEPDTAVPIPAIATGPFVNFQPYLYWTDTAATDSKQGFHTFSLNTGWSGSNVDNHSMYVLPMIKGKIPGSTPAPGNGLQPSADGKTVYDPIADVTWLANADLAKAETFTAQCTNKDGTLCIDADGSMSHTTALTWIAAMNAAHYLGQTSWQLPPVFGSDLNCAYGCTASPLGILFYSQLHLSQGTPVVPAPQVNTGPFRNLQPYLYWSCEAAPGSQALCSNLPPAPNFGWSFSFGNGFQGTDLQKNDLYVMVYYPGPQDGPRRRAVRH